MNRNLYAARVLSALLLFSALACAQSSNNQRLLSADAAFRAGYAALRQGNLAIAESQFQEVVKLAPDIGEGHSALGAVLVQLSEFHPAVAELKQALALRKDDVAAQLNLATAYEYLGYHAKSAALFQIVEQHRPDAVNPDAFRLYARALVSTEHLALGANCLRRAIKRFPRDTQLWDALGSVEAQRQNYLNASQAFREAVRLDPSFADAHLHLGLALIALQQANEALPELNAAVRLAAQNPVAHIELGKALIASGDAAKATDVLRRAVDLAPSSVEAKYQLALALQANGQVRDAIPLLRDVTVLRPNNAPALINLGLALVQVGEAQAAISLYKRAVTMTPKDPVLHQDLGVAYLQESDLNDAIDEFRAGLTLASESYELHYDLGLALKLKDNAKDAIPELEHAAQLNPDSPDPRYTLGILYMQIGQFDEAILNLRAAVELRPSNGDAWAVLGSVYKQQNKLPEAAETLQKAIEIMPTQPGPHMTLAAVLAQEGRNSDAAEQRRQAAALTKTAINRQRATFEVNTGDELLKKGSIIDAIDAYREAITSDVTFAKAHRQLAVALARLGRMAEATVEQAKANELTNRAQDPRVY